MKKLVLALAAVATIGAASAAATPASAFPLVKPTGCCGGWNPHPHWGFGGGISIGVGVVDPGFSVGPGYGGGCYYAYRKVLVPNIGIVMKKTLVCA